MESQIAKDIQFVICKNELHAPGVEFVLQTTGTQYLFQILRFDDLQKYETYVADKSNVPVVVDEREMIVLKMSGNFQYVEINQQTTNKVFLDIQLAKQAAAVWLKKYLGLDKWWC